MPKVGASSPGAATQAAARKVAESDKVGPAARKAELDRATDRVIANSVPKTGRGPLAREIDRKTETVSQLEQAINAGLRPEPGEISFETLDEADDFMVLVMYGPAGNRKTTSALRVTKAVPEGRVLVIAAESGLKRDALRGHEVDTRRVVYWPRRGERITYEGLEALFYKLLDDLIKDPGSWAAISWDSLTEVIQTLVDNAAEADIARLQEIARQAKKPFEVRKVYDREGKDYQLATGQFRQLLRKYRSLPMHHIFVALEETREESVETDTGQLQKRPVIGPSLTPKVREDVEQHADVIMRCTVVDVSGIGSVGVGRATPAGDLRAKDRYNVLPVLMIDPGWERIWAYVTGELKAETDTLQETAARVGPALEAPSEAEERKTEERKARKAERAAARETAKETTAPKAAGTGARGSARRSAPAKVTEQSGTEENPPI
jgi:hypothetical protein